MRTIEGNECGGAKSIPARIGEFDLERLLFPFDVETFKREYWERQPLVVHRGAAEHFERLLTLRDFDDILSTSNLNSTDLGLVRGGQGLSLEALVGASPALGIERVYGEYRAGSTIILQSIHERRESLNKLCSALAVELCARLQINAYLTPENAQGLNTHYDTHDVFVLQIEGSKHWRLYDAPLRLPLAGQRYQREDTDLSSRLSDEFDLMAGDALYIPRGFLHDATSSDRSSLHLTVGIHSITWAELVLARVESIVEEDATLRESLPPGFATNHAAHAEVERHLEGLIALIVSKMTPSFLVTDAVERARSAIQPALAGHLIDIELARSADLDTSVRRRPEMPWESSVTDDGVELHFHGKVMRLPMNAEAEVRHIRTNDDTFTGASLPGTLDAAGRTVLIRRLLREGFLTQAPS